MNRVSKALVTTVSAAVTVGAMGALPAEAGVVTRVAGSGTCAAHATVNTVTGGGGWLTKVVTTARESALVDRNGSIIVRFSYGTFNKYQIFYGPGSYITTFGCGAVGLDTGNRW